MFRKWFRKWVGWIALWMFATVSGSVQAYSVGDGQIYDTGGQPVPLRGVSWFGFETGNHVVHGLWARNWKDMITQMQELGFDAVRLPFCPATLTGVAPDSISYDLNPDLSGLNSLQVLDKIVQEFSDRGFHILLDHHTPDCAAISELWYTGSYTEQQWLNDLQFVAERYAAVPGVIGLDIKNEPHGSATWGTGDATDWRLAAKRAADAVLAKAPQWLIFVEGIGENPSCSYGPNHWWGGNIEPLACYPLDIPADRLVMAPHAYGPDVYVQPYFDDPSFPANMPAIWETHFGQFVQQGYAVMLGEFGGKYGQGDARDVAWQDALVDYLIGKGIRGGFYWSWNPNSGDTGGILMDDWISVRTDKVTLLQRLWGGAASGSGAGDTGSGGTDPAPAPTPAELPAQVTIFNDWGSGYCANVDVLNGGTTPVVWQTAVAVDGTLSSYWDAVPTASSGTVSFSGVDWNGTLAAGASARFGYCADRAVPPPEPPPASGDATFQVNEQVTSDWTSGYCSNVVVTNTGSASGDWQVTMQVQGTIQDLWNGIWSQAGGELQVSGVSWNQTLSPGATAEFGFCANR